MFRELETQNEHFEEYHGAFGPDYGEFAWEEIDTSRLESTFFTI